VPPRRPREARPDDNGGPDSVISRSSAAPRAATRAKNPDRGMQVLELKLSILVQGPSKTRRNPALDVLVGLVPDERVLTLQAGLSASTSQSSGPSARVLPVAAIRMAAVARSSRPAPSPWLQPTGESRPRLRLMAPPASYWSQVPVLGGLLAWLRAECRPYTLRARTLRARRAF
jgi:hypothetical protein